jgi:hypothetical protein
MAHHNRHKPGAYAAAAESAIAANTIPLPTSPLKGEE